MDGGSIPPGSTIWAENKLRDRLVNLMIKYGEIPSSGYSLIRRRSAARVASGTMSWLTSCKRG